MHAAGSKFFRPNPDDVAVIPFKYVQTCNKPWRVCRGFLPKLNLCPKLKFRLPIWHGIFCACRCLHMGSSTCTRSTRPARPNLPQKEADRSAEVLPHRPVCLVLLALFPYRLHWLCFDCLSKKAHPSSFRPLMHRITNSPSSSTHPSTWII